MSSQSHSILQHHSGAKTLFVASLIPLTFNSNQVLGQAEEAGSTRSISAQLEEVVVTAQKREQNVQDVPATINAISARALDDFSILNFEDVQSLAPGVGLQPVDARSQVIVIRGVASDPDNVATAPITPYVNDIPVVEQIIFSPLYDMARMEILRGPQGTLQGRTDPAGSILTYTQRPSMSEWDGYVQQTFTDQPGSNTQFGASLPLIQNRLALRIAGLYDDNEGQGYNNITSGQEQQHRSRSGRLTLDWVATDSLEFVLTYTHMKRDTMAFPEAIFGDPGSYPTDLATWNSPVVTDPNYPSSLDKQERKAIHQGVNSYELELNMTSLHMDWDLGPGSLSWISGYFSFQEENVLDRDISNALPLPESQLTDTDMEYASQELRYTSNTGAFGGFWDYLVGGFWERNKSETANIVDVTGSFNLFGGDNPPGTYTNDLQIPIERTNLSLYTHHTLHFSDSLNLQLGARYQDASIENRADNSDFNNKEECLIPDGTACSDNPDDLTRQEDQGLTGSVKLSWFPRDELLLYGGIDSSYRPPGVTITATPISSGNLLFDRETSTAFELGFKSSLASGHVRLNGSLFYQKFNGYQATAEAPRVYFYPDSGPESEQVVGSITFNADTTLRGAELELQSLITERWSLGAGAAYTEHHYDSGETGPCNRPLTAGEIASEVQVAQCDLGGERVSSQPLFFGNLYSEYFIPIGPAQWYIRGLYNHQSERSSYLVDRQSIPSYGVFSLWTGVRAADARWDAMLWAKNLGDTQQLAVLSNPEFVDVGPVSATSNWRRGSMIAPRTVGLTARYNW